MGSGPSEPFDPSGDYHIADRRLSAQVHHFYFDIEVRSRGGGKLVAWGHVYASSTLFRIVQITVSRQRLTFTTSRVGGVSYRFDGRFTRTGYFANQFVGNGIVAVDGAMTKVVNGKVDTVAISEYLYFPGC